MPESSDTTGTEDFAPRKGLRKSISALGESNAKSMGQLAVSFVRMLIGLKLYRKEEILCRVVDCRSIIVQCSRALNMVGCIRSTTIILSVYAYIHGTRYPRYGVESAHRSTLDIEDRPISQYADAREACSISSCHQRRSTITHQRPR